MKNRAARSLEFQHRNRLKRLIAKSEKLAAEAEGLADLLDRLGRSQFDLLDPLRPSDDLAG
jgi:hypothetical protein